MTWLTASKTWTWIALGLMVLLEAKSALNFCLLLHTIFSNMTFLMTSETFYYFCRILLIFIWQLFFKISGYFLKLFSFLFFISLILFNVFITQKASITNSFHFNLLFSQFLQFFLLKILQFRENPSSMMRLTNIFNTLNTLNFIWQQWPIKITCS